MMTTPKAAKVYLWENGMLMVFDANGTQIPELQGRNTPERLKAIQKRTTEVTVWLGFGDDGPCVWETGENT